MAPAFADLEVESAGPSLAELQESASPACKEIISTMQTCADRAQARREFLCPGGHICRQPFLPFFTLPPCQASMGGYLLCERKEMQRQLQEIQEQLQEIQEAESGPITSKVEKIKLMEGVTKLGFAPSYLLNKAVREVLESQCQKGEDGDA